LYAKVINKTQISKKEIRLWFLLLVICIAELFVFTWVRTQCVEAGYTISKLNSEQKKMTDTRDFLQVEMNQYRSPKRIAYIAEKYSGMVMPTQEQILLLE
jgi:cell division protein FtsL